MSRESVKKRAKRLLKKPAQFLAKDWSLGIAFPRTYEKAADAPIDPRKVLFIDGKSLEMPDAFCLLFPYLENHYDLDVRFVGLGMNEGVGWIGYYKRCLDLARDLATASYVFLADASDVVSCLPIRPETKVVQLWHACGAFKKFGMSTADKLFGGSRAEKERHPFYKNLDLVTVSSPEVEWAYREAMELEDTPDVVQALGISRTDVFHHEEFRVVSRDAIESMIPGIDGRKIVLYAPTFRGRATSAEGPDRLEIAKMRAALGNDWALLVKHHPFVKSPTPIPEGCEDFAFMVADVPIDCLMCAADACISDYSSIVFEYSLLDRPLLFFAYDLEDYDDWRGFYYDYDEMTPGPVVRTTDEVIDFIAHADERYDRELMASFRYKFMSACDGHATERIARTVLG